MRITFCLPAKANYPVGGYKIVYEYANRLVERGHIVNIGYDQTKCCSSYVMPEFLKNLARKYSACKRLKWFPLDKRVRSFSSIKYKNEQVPDADIIVATAATTAYPISKLDDSKGRKYYLIQGFENWDLSEDEVISTYRFGLKNMVISKWLKEIVDKYAIQESIYIPNVIDCNVFGVDNPICERRNHSIAFLYHKSENKGVRYTLEVIERLKEMYSDLKVCAFGVPSKPDVLPDWVEYYQKANQATLRTIYNDTSVFICSSVEEGFGLTGAESMACGCCLVSSDYGGVRDYAVSGQSALLSPVGDVDGMVSNVVRVFEDDALRIKIAEKGCEDIHKLSWDNSIDILEEAFML
jgi:glycosyltransferase involved in cell wall biosynthesis